jgi:KaiC/GvpD/RAD55 family RecA-like ATPase
MAYARRAPDRRLLPWELGNGDVARVAGQEHARREQKEMAEKRETSRKRIRRNEPSTTLVTLALNKQR